MQTTKLMKNWNLLVRVFVYVTQPTDHNKTVVISILLDRKVVKFASVIKWEGSWCHAVVTD